MIGARARLSDGHQGTGRIGTEGHSLSALEVSRAGGLRPDHPTAIIEVIESGSAFTPDGSGRWRRDPGTPGKRRRPRRWSCWAAPPHHKARPFAQGRARPGYCGAPRAVLWRYSAPRSLAKARNTTGFESESAMITHSRVAGAVDLAHAALADLLDESGSAAGCGWPQASSAYSTPRPDGSGVHGLSVSLRGLIERSHCPSNPGSENVPGSLAPWLPGSLAPWLPGSLAPWLPGSLAPWIPRVDGLNGPFADLIL